MAKVSPEAIARRSLLGYTQSRLGDINRQRNSVTSSVEQEAAVENYQRRLAELSQILRAKGLSNEEIVGILSQASGGTFRNEHGGAPPAIPAVTNPTSNLRLVMGTGGSMNPMGHGWIEVEPTGKGASNWGGRTSYGFFMDGLKENEELGWGYDPGVVRHQRTVPMDRAMEAALLKSLAEWRARRYGPHQHCATFAVDAFNDAAPADRDLDMSAMKEQVDTSQVASPELSAALEGYKKMMGDYPVAATPRSIGRWLSQHQ